MTTTPGEKLILASLALAGLLVANNVQAQTPSPDELITAVLRRDAATVKLLLERGATADGTIGGDVSALMLAASASSSRLTPRDRPSVGANESVRDTGDDVAVMELLIAHGAHVNARDAAGHTALWWAAAFANKASNTRLLIRHHADVNARDTAGRILIASVMRAADDSANESTFALLTAGADANAKNDRGIPLLLMATQSNRPSLMRALLNAGANPNLAERNGRTALMITAANDSLPEQAQILIDAGADVNAQNSAGDTPLIAAVRRGSKALLQTLLKGGASVRGDAAEEAVREAATLNRTEALRALLEGGADPNGVGHNSLTGHRY